MTRARHRRDGSPVVYPPVTPSVTSLLRIAGAVLRTDADAPGNGPF